MRFKLVEDVDKLGALDKLDSLFGQSDVYMWSTYILPNGHFLNPDNSSDYWEEIDSDPEYEHSDFIYNNYNPYGEDLFDDCIKMNVTYPYLILPENRPTPEQYQAIKSIIDNKDGFHYALSDIEDRLGRDLGHMGEPLLVQTPFADTVFDLSKVDKYDIVKAINKAYLTKSFLNESKVRKDLIDLTNKKFGDLTVIEYDKEKSRKTGQTYWKCKCSCGNETVVSRKHLLNGDIKSCGHTKRQNGLDHYEDNFKGMRDRQNKYHTNLEIIRNQKMQPNNTSGVKGVDYHKGRDMWRARVRVNGKELTKWSKDKDVAIKWRQDAIDKYYKPQIDKAIKAGDLKENKLKTWAISDVDSYVRRKYKSLINRGDLNREFILPNGDFLSTGLNREAHINIEHDIQNYLAKRFDIENFKHSKLDHPVTDMCGWIRVNNINEDYICLSSVKPTIEQYSSLTRWLDEFNEMSDFIRVVSFDGSQQITYDLNDIIVDDIIKNIKRFYSSGILYESLQEKV